MTVKLIAARMGVSEAEVLAAIEAGVMDSVALAVCPEYCEVEPDGYCEHGRPSVLIAMGMI